jgi:hypothetical protein
MVVSFLNRYHVAAERDKKKKKRVEDSHGCAMAFIFF